MSGSLFLFPEDPWHVPPTAAVQAVLHALGVSGPVYGDHSWLAGDGLLRHVTFAGCSPCLEFSPPADGGDFCHVRLLGPYPVPRMFTGPHTLKPRCSACGSRMADWQPLAAAYAQDPARPWRCPACGAAQPVERLRWRHHAAFGRLLVEVRSVFPAEGMPGDELLAGLGEIDAHPWSFAWAASSD